MRSKALVAAVVVCLSHLALPAPAEAIFGRGWLERLSGPGPFTGVTFGQDFICISRPVDDDAIATFEESLGRRVTVRPSKERIVHAGLVGCNYLPRDTPRLQIGFQASRLSSTDNLLDYTDRPEVGDREVNVSMLLLTLDVRVNRVLDVGTAFGNARFSPDNDALFGDFTRGVWQPLRVSMRPLAAVLPDKRFEAFTIQLELNHIPAGFKDTDFGARPGTFDEPSELLWNWWVGVDVGKFFWK
jgi:hypothetical protein